MPAHTFVRAQVKARLAALFTNATAVPVARSFPPEFPDELIWFATTTGGIEYAALGANLPRDDIFSVTVIASCRKSGNDADEAEARAEEIAGVIVTTLAEYVTLDDWAPEEFSILDALITSIDGPESDRDPDGEGYIAAVALTVEIHLRITREQ